MIKTIKNNDMDFLGNLLITLGVVFAIGFTIARIALFLV